MNNNNNLLKSLMLRMQNERFNPNIINCRYFKELPSNLINSLLRLNRNDFRQYVLFISLLKEKHLLACNSENLIRTFSVPSLDNIKEGWTYYHDLEELFNSNYDEKSKSWILKKY